VAAGAAPGGNDWDGIIGHQPWLSNPIHNPNRSSEGWPGTGKAPTGPTGPPPPGTFGPSGEVFHPTSTANTFYGNLLGDTQYNNQARYQPKNEFGGGFEEGQDNLRTDIGKSFESLFGKPLPYQFSNYNFQMGDTDPQRQAYQMAHWFFGGPQHGWSPGIDRTTGNYNAAAQTELQNFQKAVADARKAGHGTFPTPPGTPPPPAGNGGDGTQHT
jgi:hypothetical protein